MESILVIFLFLFEIPTGILADKFGRKKAIIFGSLFLLLEPVLLLFAENFFHFALSFALAGIGITFHPGSIESHIYDFLKAQNKEKEMKKAMGRVGSATLIAMMIAPMIGSFLAQDLVMDQFHLLLLLTIGAISIGGMLSFTLQETYQQQKNNQSLELLKKSINQLITNKALRQVVMVSIFTTPFIYILHYLYQPYLKDTRIPPLLIGSIFALALGVSSLFQAYAYKIEELLGAKKTMLIACYLLTRYSFYSYGIYCTTVGSFIALYYVERDHRIKRSSFFALYQ